MNAPACPEAPDACACPDTLPRAQVVWRNRGIILVNCPLCFSVHQHGDGGDMSVDVSGNAYSCHNHMGSYIVKGMYDFRTAQMLLSQREADLIRRRAAHARVKAALALTSKAAPAAAAAKE